MSCKDLVDFMIMDLLEKLLNNVLLVIRKEYLLLMFYVCNESILYLFGEKGILKEIDDFNVVNNYFFNNKKVIDNEINDIKVNLFYIFIDFLDDVKVNFILVIDLILEIFLKFLYINDVRILDWCFNKRM